MIKAARTYVRPAQGRNWHRVGAGMLVMASSFTVTMLLGVIGLLQT